MSTKKELIGSVLFASQFEEARPTLRLSHSSLPSTAPAEEQQENQEEAEEARSPVEERPPSPPPEEQADSTPPQESLRPGSVKVPPRLGRITEEAEPESDET